MTDRYRQIFTSFWSDTKIHDNFTAEDKFFYLYLLTNTYTTLTGCYEISPSQMSQDTGKTKEEVNKLMGRMINIHNVIRYNKETNEVLILNWHKYNWNKSPKLIAGVLKATNSIKDASFKSYVLSLVNNEEPELPEEAKEQEIETSIVSKEKKKKSDTKHHYGEYKKIMLTDEEYNKLVEKLGEDFTKRCIQILDEAIVEKGYKYASHYMVIAKKGSWVQERAKNIYSSTSASNNVFLNMLNEGA